MAKNNAVLVFCRHWMRLSGTLLVCRHWDKPQWRNGRRARLKIEFLTECEFDSHLRHQQKRPSLSGDSACSDLLRCPFAIRVSSRVVP